MTPDDDATTRDTPPAVVRIEIEYADGRTIRAVGDDADAIWRAYEDAIVFRHIHGMPYRGPVMAEVRPATSPAMVAPTEPAP